MNRIPITTIPPQEIASASVASKRGNLVFFQRDGFDKHCKWALDLMKREGETGVRYKCGISRQCNRIDKGHHDCCSAYDKVEAKE